MCSQGSGRLGLVGCITTLGVDFVTHVGIDLPILLDNDATVTVESYMTGETELLSARRNEFGIVPSDIVEDSAIFEVHVVIRCIALTRRREVVCMHPYSVR